MNANFRTGTFAAIAAAVLTAMSGCNGVLGGCDAVSIPGLAILVVDSASNTAPVNVTLVRIADGDYVNDLQPGSNESGLRYFGAWDRKGNYGLLIKATGYKDYTAGNISVREKGCHVVTTSVTAKLQRTP